MKDKFSVFTTTILEDNGPQYVHWSEGLKMYITKNGVTITLNPEEIKQLVKSLPKTVGGIY